MFLRTAILSAVVAFLTTTTAQAGFTVSIGNSSVTAGGTTIVDVRISGGPELLDFFVTEFRITPVGSAATGGLQFTNPQGVSYGGDSSYAFLGNSAYLSRAVTTNVSVNDTLTVGDFTTDFAGVDVSGGKLLARLELAAGSSVIVGSQYSIEVFLGGTQFQDPNFQDVGFAWTAGTVEVTGSSGGEVSATPAPSGLILVASGVLPVLAALRYRRPKGDSEGA